MVCEEDFRGYTVMDQANVQLNCDCEEDDSWWGCDQAGMMRICDTRISPGF